MQSSPHFYSFVVFCVVFVLFFTLDLIVVLFISPVKFEKPDKLDERKGPRAKESLKFLVVVSRHGNRGSIDYPMDPYPINDKQFWPYGEHGLTQYGRVQMYNLGRKIRSLYNGFVSSTFNPKELHASSTAMDRILMSGELFLAGLYPPLGFQVWNKHLLWQPVPIYSDSLDRLLDIMKGACPKVIKEISKVLPPVIEEHSKVIAETIRIINKETNSNISEKSFVDVSTTWDKMINEVTEGFTLPAWSKQFFPEPLEKLVSEFYISASAGTETIQRLWMGEFFTEMLDSMKRKADGNLPAGRRLHYYSGHDTSIVALQAMLGVAKSDIIGVVKTGSALIIELHQDLNNRFKTQVLYIDGASSDLEPVNLLIETCGKLCDFGEIHQKTKRFTNVNFEQECYSGDRILISNLTFAQLLQSL